MSAPKHRRTKAMRAAIHNKVYGTGGADQKLRQAKSFSFLSYESADECRNEIKGDHEKVKIVRKGKNHTNEGQIFLVVTFEKIPKKKEKGKKGD